MKFLLNTEKRFKVVSLLFTLKREHTRARSFGEVYMLLINIISGSVANYSSLQIVGYSKQKSSLFVNIKIDSYKNQYDEFLELIATNCWLELPIHK